MAIYDLGTASLAANGEVTGVGTTWKAPLTLIRVGATIIFKTSPLKIYTISEIISDTQINVYNPNSETVPSGTGYAILAHDGITVQGLAQDVAETLRYYQSKETSIEGLLQFIGQDTFDWPRFEQLAKQSTTGAAEALASQIAAEESADTAISARDATTAARDQTIKAINNAGDAGTLVTLAGYGLATDTTPLISNFDWQEFVFKSGGLYRVNVSSMINAPNDIISTFETSIAALCIQVISKSSNTTTHSLRVVAQSSTSNQYSREIYIQFTGAPGARVFAPGREMVMVEAGKSGGGATASMARNLLDVYSKNETFQKSLNFSDVANKSQARANLDVYSKNDSDRLRCSICLFDFGAIGDGLYHPLSERFNSLAEAQAVYPFVSSLSQSIDYAAIQVGVNTAIQSKRKLIIPGGSFYSSDPIEIKVENHYSKTGLDMSGQGRAASTIIFPKGSDGLRIVPVTPGQYTYNVALSDFDIVQDEFDGSTVGLGGFGIRVTNGCSQMFWTNLRIQGFGTMVKFDDAVFLSRFIGLHSSLCGNGFIMGTMGTTNFIDNIFVYGSIGTAYKITCVYSSIGSLACDRCSGVPYDFVDYSGSVGSLGWESAKADTNGPIVRLTRSKAAIGTIYGFDLESSPSFSSYFSFGESEIDISKVNLESEGGVSKTLTSKFYVMFRSKVSIRSVISNYTFTFVEPSIDSDLNSSYIELDGIKQSHGGVRPYIGDLGDSSRSIVQPGKDYTRPAFIFDCYGGFSRAGATGQKDLYYVQGPRLGMWGIERRPDVHGTAAYVSLSDAEYNGTAKYAVVPAILYGVGRPENPVTGTHWSDPNSKKVFYYAYGQWQDYMGNVLP